VVILAVAALGVAIGALFSVPAVGPTGAVGPQGPIGVQGVTGKTGVAGPVGPAGTIKSTDVVAATALVSTPNPEPGAVLVAKTSCPVGDILLGGGARVSAPGVIPDRSVMLRSSFPLTTSTWQTVSIVTGPLGAGTSMTMKPYVLCGKP